MKFNKEFKIADRTIGANHKPFIIAEMSGNHNQSIERALEIVDTAASSGAHAIKLQTYNADTMTLNLKTNEFFIKDEENLWKGQSLYELYEKAYTPWEWHEQIFKHAQKRGLICFSSPFDETAVDFLESLNAPCYKVASFENTDIPLIKKIAKTGKPIIMSTGMATFNELATSLEVIASEGNKNVVLLKCTSSYPAVEKDANLRTIVHLRESFGLNVGLSDHSMGISVPLVATALGATVIEKHFTINREDGGVDSAFSLNPQEFKFLVEEVSNAYDALGCVSYECSEKEKKSKLYKRSIYISNDVKKGEVLTRDNIKVIRPAYGLAPIYFENILGRVAKVDMDKGTPLSWDKI